MYQANEQAVSNEVLEDNIDELITKAVSELPFLSESSRKLFGREPLETQLLNPMALFLNLLAHFSRTWACFS
jgi:hypothetical protein